MRNNDEKIRMAENADNWNYHKERLNKKNVNTFFKILVLWMKYDEITAIMKKRKIA